MIAVAVRDYDDENVIEECESGWRRFCAEVLVRTHYHVTELCSRHRKCGSAGMVPRTRKEWETLRRQVAAYRWVFDGTGGLFTFDQTCADLGIDPALIRRKLLSQARPEGDINLLVRWVSLQQERPHKSPRRSRRRKGWLVRAVREFRQQAERRPGRRGAQTHAVCRYGRGRQRPKR